MAENLQLKELMTESTISYNALADSCSTSTLRFTGQVHGKTIQILLDEGSTHNFVQTRVASYLRLPIETTTQFFILVGNGYRLNCSDISRKVPLVIQGQEISVDFHVLPLHGWDMVLGIEWLATLGPVVTDYAFSIFQFTYNGHKVCWQGNRFPVAQLIQYNALHRL